MWIINRKIQNEKNSKKLILIDEISGGNMRAFKDGKYLEPLELEKLVTA